MINGKMIAIDARMIEMSGIGTYIQHLMGQGIYDYAFGNEKVIHKYDKTVKVIPYDAPIYSPQEQISFPSFAAKRAGICLVHFPHYNVPLSYRGKFVVTVHDLTHIILPEFLGNKLKFFYAKFLLSNALKRSEHIFTVSENSKKDICKIFKIREQKIAVTYDAVDKDFRKKDISDVQYLYDKYQIPKNKKILMYVGNLKPHKNLARLVEAFSKSAGKDTYRLLLVGKAFTSVDLIEIERNLGIESLVIHTGLVEKEELIDLYNLADLFIFPSLYEGFGIPPLEAMACGTPVIAANNSSIPEVVGEAAILFDALDIVDIKNSIDNTVGDDLLLHKLVDLGTKQFMKFRWETTIEEVKNCIDRITK